MTDEIWYKKLNLEKQKEYCQSHIILKNIDKYCIERIGKEFEKYRKSYEHERDLIFEDYILEYLENLDSFESWEYKFYCWLCKIKNKLPKVNKPYDDFSYIKIQELEFKKAFVYNAQRIALYDELEKLYSLFRENDRFKLKKTEIIIGGSYVSAKENPRDIDFAICVSENLFLNSNEQSDSYFIRVCFGIKNILDFKFFPINFDDTNYYVYGWLVNLFNKAEFKEKCGGKIQNNYFEKLKLIKFEKNV